ncbi:MAG: hypothetical protein H0V94_05890 [Actinobacteria bacterium]|nr:hypothetical protein [Actinomycetota bacterium]
MKAKRSKALWAVAALLAVNAVLLAAQPGLALSKALPNGLASYLYGPNLVRAEVLVKDGGALHDYRIDRGVIRDKAPGSLTLRERDASIVTIAVAPGATISIRGRAASFSALRRGMVATVIRDGDAPAGEVRAVGR